MACKKDKYTITFDEKVKGWTSFHSYYPDYMLGINNKFFSFKEGNLYLHNSDKVDRSNYYGESFPSRVSLMVNESPSDVKLLQAVSMEGSHPWKVAIEAYVSDVSDAISSSLKETDFYKKEGLWYAHARRNENENHTDSRSTYGIGETSTVIVNQIQVNGGNSSLTVGDTILRGSDLAEVGVVDSHSKSGGTTTINFLSTNITLNQGDFVLGRKNPRIEGGNLRGYTMRMNLEISNIDKIELFAVNSEVMKSFT